MILVITITGMIIFLLACLYRLFHFILIYNNLISIILSHQQVKELELRKDNYLAWNYTDSEDNPRLKNTISGPQSFCLGVIAQQYGENKMLYCTAFSNSIVSICQNELRIFSLKEVSPLISVFLYGDTGLEILTAMA